MKLFQFLVQIRIKERPIPKSIIDFKDVEEFQGAELSGTAMKDILSTTESVARKDVGPKPAADDIIQLIIYEKQRYNQLKLKKQKQSVSA